MKKLTLILLSTVLIATGCSHRSREIYTVNHHMMPVESNKLTREQRVKYIIKAANKHNWKCKETSTQTIMCRVDAQIQMATVEIKHNRDTFSIKRLKTENLNYDSGGYIHQRYNFWIKNLERSIESTLAFQEVLQP